jgi:cell division protease FtsH
MPRRSNRQRPRRTRRWPIVAAIGASLVLGLVAYRLLHPTTAPTPTVSFSELAQALAAHDVSELRVDDGGARLVATLRAPRTISGQRATAIEANVPQRAVTLTDLQQWSARGVRVTVEDAGPTGGIELLIQIMSLVIIVGVVIYVVIRQRGAVASARFVATPPSRHLTLADVGGAREARADLSDVVTYLADPDRYRALGARCPRGVLLVGPPGTGKTLLARAVAGEAGCPVIVAAGSDFNEVYVGVGSRRVRQLAKRAREQAPCIVFIDEFDSLGGRRGRPNRSGEEEVTLNQLLVEMDGMEANDGVVWMAATNREDMLDPAVRRPGRFDRVVEVPLPTVTDRAEILRVHAAGRPFGPDVDLERLAQLTVGHSGADLANLLNEAAIIAVQDDCERITNSHIEQARDKVLLGRVRTGVIMGEAERRLIAIHEAGHAIVGLVACPDDRLHKVTIEPRGRSLGAAHFAPESDRHVHPRSYLEGVIAKALGGRAAELVFLGPDAVTTGAGADLVQATSIAHRMVAEFGMSDEVGLISADPTAQGGPPSAQLQGEIDHATRSLISAQARRAEAIVREHQGAVDALASALLERDVLTATEVYEIAGACGVAPARSTA